MVRRKPLDFSRYRGRASTQGTLSSFPGLHFQELNFNPNCRVRGSAAPSACPNLGYRLDVVLLTMLLFLSD